MVVALVSIVLTATAMVMDLPASTATAIAALRRYGIGGRYSMLFWRCFWPLFPLQGCQK
jgi:hypothetical protein